MNFKCSFNDQPTIVSFTTLIEETFASFHLPIKRLKNANKNKLNTNTLKTIHHFPVKNSKTSWLKTENHEPLRWMATI